MSCSNINIIVNSCLKLDPGLRQKILGNWNKDFLFGCPPTYGRSFHSSQKLVQAQKDTDTVLPSPQEVSVLFQVTFSTAGLSVSSMPPCNHHLTVVIPASDYKT